jgi:hypothetical protein
MTMIKNPCLPILLLTLFACQAAPPGRERVTLAGKPSPEAVSAMDRLKRLEGSWWGNIEEKKIPASATFAISSKGSAVREIMGAGTEYEMTNMYHLDGDRVVITHYCAAGNQPRMVSTKIADNMIVFELDSISNHQSNQEGCMGRLEVEFDGSDHIIQRWTSLGTTEKDDHTATFDLRR